MESTKLKVITVTSVLTGFSLAAMTLPAVAIAHSVQEADTIAEALGEKSFHNLELRARHERAKDKLPAVNPELKSGRLTSLRTQLTYGTGAVCDTSGQVTVTNVSGFFGTKKYNPGINSVTDRTANTIINDPKGTDLNEFFVQNSSIPDTNVKVGNQFFSLDNERFFGKDDFRQNPQSYRGITVANNTFADTTLTYAFFEAMNLNTHNYSGEGRLDQNTHVFHGNWAGVPWGQFSVYYHRIKDKGQRIPLHLGTGAPIDTSRFSVNNYGIRFSGDYDIEASYNANVDYELEYARQRSRSNNPVADKYRANYWLGGIGATMNDFHVGLRYEVVGGRTDQTASQFKFLGSNHEFLGKAGVFEFAPSAGVKDLMLGLGYTYDKFNVGLDGHRFKPESGGGTRYGNEWDLSATYNFTENYYATATYARFNAKAGNLGFVGNENAGADTELGDVTKYWLTLGAKF